MLATTPSHRHAPSRRAQSIATRTRSHEKPTAENDLRAFSGRRPRAPSRATTERYWNSSPTEALLRGVSDVPGRRAGRLFGMSLWNACVVISSVVGAGRQLHATRADSLPGRAHRGGVQLAASTFQQDPGDAAPRAGRRACLQAVGLHGRQRRGVGPMFLRPESTRPPKEFESSHRASCAGRS